MLVTRSIDGKTEASFTTNGTDWEWFNNLTPASIYFALSAKNWEVLDKNNQENGQEKYDYTTSVLIP